MKFLSILTIAFGFTGSFFINHAHADFPENKLHLRTTINASDITKEEFEQISNSTIDMFKPYALQHGAELRAVNNWGSETVNAYARQSGGKWTGGRKWYVNMFGGLARRPEVSRDGFALVVCHELGHHFGGYYFAPKPWFGIFGTQWAACEGQADYFATQVCARMLWEKDTTENAKHRKTVNVVAKKECDEAWTNAGDQDLCYRTAEAGKSLATLLQAMKDDYIAEAAKNAGKEPPPPTVVDYSTPDKSVVTKTDTVHPEAQCRLDTYMAGAVCTADYDLMNIPGRPKKGGKNNMPAQQAAAKYSCTPGDNYKIGIRPACWFKSL